MPTDQPILSVSSSLRSRDCQKANPQSPPTPPKWQCSAPPTRSISRRYVPHDDESPHANVRAEPRPPPSTLSLKSRAVGSRLISALSTGARLFACCRFERLDQFPARSLQ